MIRERVPTKEEIKTYVEENGWKKLVKIVPPIKPREDYPEYKVGYVYEIEGEIKLCEKGFHASENYAQCNQYYKIDENSRYLRVRLSVKEERENDKAVGDKIFIESEEDIEKVKTNLNGEYVLKYGTKFWYKDGQIHREGGPAVEDIYGTKEWYKEGKHHREGGPAIEWPDGKKEWHKEGKLHREEGPAIEYPDGTKIWYKDGQLHREGGPAIEYPSGRKVWYKEGKRHRENGPAVEDPSEEKSGGMREIVIGKETSQQ